MTQVFGQYTVSGRVVDEDTKEGLPGATLYFPDLRKGTATNEGGEYTISELPRGTFTIEVKYVGYATRVAQIEITSDQSIDFALSSTPTEMNEVVVTGVSAATELRRNPVAVRILSGSGIRESASSNIVDAITRLPGVSQISTGPAISKPVIRGLGYNRVIVLYDGVRQEGQQWGDEHGLELDEYAVDRAEVVKGPGSLMYGSDGIGGVVNFIPATTVADGVISGEALLNYQSNNNLMAASFMNTGTMKGVSWLLRATGKQAGNYRNRLDGRVYNSGFHEADVSGFVGISKSWGYSQLHFTSFDQTLALPEGERDEDGNFMKPIDEDNMVTVTGDDLKGYHIGIPSQRVRHLRLFSTNNFLLGGSRITANVGYQLSRRQEFGNPENPDESELFFNMPTGTYDFKYFLPVLQGWRFTLGTSGMIQSNENRGAEYLIPDYQLFDAGFFGVFQKWFDRVNLSGGFRYDHRSLEADALYLNSSEEPTTPDDPDGELKFSELSRTFGSYSGSIGAAMDVAESWVLKANLSRGYRSPNLAELTSNGRHEGSFRYEVGDPNLEPETSFQFDGAVSYTTDHLSVDVDVFHNTITNYIYAIKLQSTLGGDSIADPLDPAPVYKYIQAKAVLYGGEVRVDLHPHPLDWLHFENTFSLVRGIQPGEPDSTHYLPLIPAPKWSSELRANFKQGGKSLANLFAKLSLDMVFDQNQYRMENNTETATPGYALVNIGLGADLLNRKGKSWCKLILTGTNLFNTAYQSHLSRLKYAPENTATGRVGIFDRGRNISVKMIVPLSFKSSS